MSALLECTTTEARVCRRWSRDDARDVARTNTISMESDSRQTVERMLFANKHCAVYAVLDGASADPLLDLLHDFEPEHECLYSGELEPDMLETAPYLVKLEPGSPMLTQILEQGWGHHWGIFIRAEHEVSMRDVRKHLRSLFLVRDPDDQVLYFRYYDPRVMRVFLPTCSSEELKAMFGPLMTILFEGQNPQMLVVNGLDESGSLVRREHDLGERE